LVQPARIFNADYSDETDYTDEFKCFIRAIRFIRVIRGKNPELTPSPLRTLTHAMTDAFPGPRLTT
jgi:hypothetical protein